MSRLYLEWAVPHAPSPDRKVIYCSGETVQIDYVHEVSGEWLGADVITGRDRIVQVLSL